MSQWIAQQLLVALLTTSAVVALVLALLSRRRDPVARHRVLVCFLPVLVLLLPVQLLTSEFSPARDAPSGAGTTAPALPGAAASGRPGELTESADGTLVGPAHGAALRKGATDFTPWSRGTDRWLALAYAAGAGLLLLAVAARAVQTVRLLRTCRGVREPRVLALWRELLAGCRRGHGTSLLQSARTRVPGCWGFLRSAVVVPRREVRRVDLDRLSLVLRHELVHVTRRDVPVSLAQQLARAILWFSPLVWVYSMLLSRYRELSCDAIVVRQTGRHQTYAKTLLEYCRGNPGVAGVSMAGGSGGRGTRSEIRRRLNMILQMQERGVVGAMIPRWLVGAAAGLALGGTVLAAAVIGPGAMPAQPAAKAEPQATKTPELKLKYTDDGMTTDAQAGTKWPRVAIDGPPGERSADSVLRMHDLLVHEGRLRPGERLSGTVTEQETLLSCEKATVRDNLVQTAELILNMPEGSKLRSELLGKEITLQRPEGEIVLEAPASRLRLLDALGVARVLVQGSREGEYKLAPKVEKATDGNGVTLRLELVPPPDVTLRVSVRVDKGEVTMRITARKADGSPADVQAELDLKTGVPPDEQDPPPGSVRYRLQPPEEPSGRARVKMQWKYDMSQAGKEEGEKKDADKPKGTVR